MIRGTIYGTLFFVFMGYFAYADRLSNDPPNPTNRISDFSPITPEALQRSSMLKWEKRKQSDSLDFKIMDPPPKTEDPSPIMRGGEVVGGGLHPASQFVARGHIIVEAMEDYNLLYADFPWARIPQEHITNFKKALKTPVHEWKLRPSYKGEPRDAGVFKDPENNGELSIAIHRQTFLRLAVNAKRELNKA